MGRGEWQTNLFESDLPLDGRCRLLQHFAPRHGRDEEVGLVAF